MFVFVSVAFAIIVLLVIEGGFVQFFPLSKDPPHFPAMGRHHEYLDSDGDGHIR